jgi:hypothetical protein
VELLALAHGVRHHVEQPSERASDLTLDRHRAHDELEVLRADALGHVHQCVVHRPSQARLVEHALELLGGRVDALVDHALDALAEAVARLQGRGHRHEHVRQLLVERLQSPARLEREERVREEHADAESDHHRHRRVQKSRAQEGEQQPEAEHDVGELGCLERPVRPLEQRVDLLPLLQVPQHALRGLEKAGEQREAPPFALSLECLLPRGGDMRIQSAAQPGSLRRGQREGGGDESEEPHHAGEDGQAPVARVEEVWQERGRLGCDRRRIAGGGQLGPELVSAREGDHEVEAVAGPGSGHVVELPGSAQILCDRVVDVRERRRGSGPVVVAVRRVGKAPEGTRVETTALDPDRVHGYVSVPGGRDGLVERRALLRRVGAVGEENEHTGLVLLAAEEV